MRVPELTALRSTTGSVATLIGSTGPHSPGLGQQWQQAGRQAGAQTRWLLLPSLCPLQVLAVPEGPRQAHNPHLGTWPVSLTLGEAVPALPIAPHLLR